MTGISFQWLTDSFYRPLALAGFEKLAAMATQKLDGSWHGDLKKWLDVIDRLPRCEDYQCLDRDAPVLGKPFGDLQKLRQQLLELHPWRKGPLELGGVSIDTEWRSDWKWNRIAPHVDLHGHRVLDIGCGNGYFGLRMLGGGADLVVGVDPTLVFVMQWMAMQKLCPVPANHVLPLGIEELPADTGGFDSVFSMGVLYHRRRPEDHLRKLKRMTRSGGRIILETLVLEGRDDRVLTPAGRYARMRNVHAIPTLPVLETWLKTVGLGHSRVLDVSKTTIEEQRSTEWMTFESLRECLDKDNPQRTVEGHPAPVRAALRIDVP